MNTFLRAHFGTDTLPSKEVLQKQYDLACKVVNNRSIFPDANHSHLNRLIEEMEADAEICNIID